MVRKLMDLYLSKHST